jgi:hypothetical protein
LRPFLEQDQGTNQAATIGDPTSRSEGTEFDECNNNGAKE